MRTEHLKSMEGKLWEVDAFLVGKTFFVGEKVSVADFAMYHPIKWHKELDSEINPVQKVRPCPFIQIYLGFIADFILFSSR